MSDRERPTVAIACQGGGSHTAFTAGVLQRLLVEDGEEYDVVALTGTSGGALCAFLTWYGLRTGDVGKATSLLEGFWNDLAATSVPARLLNESFVTSEKLRSNGFPVWRVSPSANPLASVGRQWLRSQLQRRIDAAPVEELVGQRSGNGGPARPTLHVSAIDATDGGFGVFTDDLQPAANGGANQAARRRPDTPPSTGDEAPGGDADERRDQFDRAPMPLTIDAVIASTAVPTLYEPVQLPGPDGTTHAYWDGLLAQNPPVRNLLTGTRRADRKPDEIWVVRINPRDHRGQLESLEAIADRRNELAGNLSLHQELQFIDRVNSWIREGMFTEAATERYKHVTVREVELDERRLDGSRELVRSTKLDRDPELIGDLVALGERQASEFLSSKTSDEFVLVE